MSDVITPTNSLVILKRRLAATVILLNVLICVLAGLSLYQSRLKDERQAAVTTQNLASVLDRYIEGEINSIDMALIAVKFEAERQIARGGIEKGILNRYMARQHSYLPSLQGLRMTNARGEVMYGVGDVPPGAVAHNNDRDFFTFTRDNPDSALFISAPVQGRIARKWVLHMARRVNNPDGSFAGSVYGAIPVEFFTTIFSAIDVGAKGTVNLRDGQLGLIAIYPEPPGIGTSIGNRNVAKEFADLITAGINNATFTARARIDSIERLYSYRRIATYPLYLSVALAKADYLADWRKETLTQLSLVVFITLVTLISSRMLYVRWRREKEAEACLRGYAKRLVEIEEELRKKIAAELHDEIGRDLTALGMNVAFISTGLTDDAPKRICERIEDSGRLIRDISRTVRDIMAGLRPPVLDDYGLLAAVQWHADLFFKRTGITVSVRADEHFPRLMVEKEIALFRIVQEALMNVAKHAGTEDVTIRLDRAAHMVRLAIVDEGSGFMPAADAHCRTEAGWGVKIMRERAESIGAQFCFDSEPGKGTAVTVALPLEEV